MPVSCPTYLRVQTVHDITVGLRLAIEVRVRERRQEATSEMARVVSVQVQRLNVRNRHSNRVPVRFPAEDAMLEDPPI